MTADRDLVTQAMKRTTNRLDYFENQVILGNKWLQWFKALDPDNLTERQREQIEDPGAAMERAEEEEDRRLSEIERGEE